MRIAILFLLSLALLRAEDIYVAQLAAGADDGTSAANAKSLDWLRTVGNWGVGASKVSAGDTVHLVGTFTNHLNILASGTDGNLITILFEANAKFSWPAWPNDGGGCIRATNKSYFVIDGGIQGGLPNGIIEATDNGTGLTYQRINDGVVGLSCSFFTVQNLIVKNLYQRTGVADGFSGCIGIRNSDINVAWRDFTVSNCFVGNCLNGIYATFAAPGASNVIWTGNHTTNCNWGFGIGDNGAGVMRHVVVTSCSSSNSIAWEDAIADHHHNGLYFFAENGGTLTDITIERSVFGPGYGTSTTGGIFMSGGLGVINLQNNLFLASGATPANGHIIMAPYNNAAHICRIMNNTIVGSGGGIGIDLSAEVGAKTASITNYVRNNLIKSVGTAIAVFWKGTGVEDIDYNMASDLGVGTHYSRSTTGSAGFCTLATWQSEQGNDTHGGTNQNPNLNADYTLPVSSPAIGAGEDLSAYFSNDKNGNSRSVPFDSGAFEFVPTPGTTVNVHGTLRVGTIVIVTP